MFSASAIRASSSSEGRMRGLARWTVKAGWSGAFAFATSAGTISTATPFFASAACAAIAVRRRACSGVAISSQKTEQAE